MAGTIGQGETVAKAKPDLVAAIRLILADRRKDALRGLRPDAIQVDASYDLLLASMWTYCLP